MGLASPTTTIPAGGIPPSATCHPSTSKGDRYPPLAQIRNRPRNRGNSNERIQDQLKHIVRGSVEETLNALLDGEADRLCRAGRYERTDARQDTRAGAYQRKLQTTAGEVRLKVPKLRRQTFETAIIERYRRREASVEEALMEMYLAGVSVRRVEDITEALWGTRVSPSTVSNLNKKIYAKIEDWRNRPIEGRHPYVYLDGIVLKRSWAGEVRNVSLLVAIGVNAEGYREILGICEGAKEDKKGWSAFLKHLKERGLAGVELVISDACLGLIESVAEFYPEAQWQRCVVGLLKKSLVGESGCTLRRPRLMGRRSRDSGRKLWSTGRFWWPRPPRWRGTWQGKRPRAA